MKSREFFAFLGRAGRSDSEAVLLAARVGSKSRTTFSIAGCRKIMLFVD
jgi:hypothetical protein